MHFKLSRPWLNAQFLKWVKILFWMRNICTEHSWEMVTVSHSPGNKYHTREGISDTLYSAIIQLNKLVTPTHALEFKIIPLFPTPHLLTLPLCSFFWTELPCSQPTTLSNLSPCSFCLPWENHQAQREQFWLSLCNLEALPSHSCTLEAFLRRGQKRQYLFLPPTARQSDK